MTNTITVYDTEDSATAALNLIPADEAFVAKFRQLSIDKDRARQESFDRCDTDGYLSQWAYGVKNHQHEVEAQLAEHSNMRVWPVLVEIATGNIVSIKCFTFPNQWAYGIRHAWRVVRNGATTWVTDYKRESNFTERGLRKAWMVLPTAVALRHPLDQGLGNSSSYNEP